MKRTLLIIFCALLFFVRKGSAQITFEQSYPGPNSLAATRLQMINMGNNDYKYAYVDYQSNQLNLFNLDHSPHLTLNVPVTLINSAEYVVAYITKSLFDCDSSMFEYAIISQSNWRNNFYVYREDGTLLFQMDSVIAPYCFGCFSGSYEVRPIVSSPAGTKLFLAIPDSTGSYKTVNVYSLCGELPVDVLEIDAASAMYAKVFPNPSDGQVYFEFDLLSNMKNYELTIYNSSVQTIKTKTIDGSSKREYIDGAGLASGIYFFTLREKNKVLQTGKFIISK